MVSDRRTGLCISKTKKSQSNGRNLHFEHVCFCVVEPEIPYLLTESLIFFFFFVFVAIFCGAGRN